MKTSQQTNKYKGWSTQLHTFQLPISLPRVGSSHTAALGTRQLHSWADSTGHECYQKQCKVYGSHPMQETGRFHLWKNSVRNQQGHCCFPVTGSGSAVAPRQSQLGQHKSRRRSTHDRKPLKPRKPLF